MARSNKTFLTWSFKPDSNRTHIVADKPLNYRYCSVTDINPTQEFLGTALMVPQKVSEFLLRSVICVHNTL